ncbi:hypothetical protein GCM10025859_07890 [Alicyclobacillus fastidiosus]|nr:hypothetical protein GCM10025859_07890 [Alicyclobacillus fastidiosus]
MPNGRCYLHGGASTGAPPEKMRGNKNGLVTGARESISYDTLDEVEQRLWHEIDVDVLAQLDEQIRLSLIRQRRMMQRIYQLMEGPEMVDREMTEGESENEQSGKGTSRSLTKEVADERILRIEEALTRIQTVHVRLLQQKYAILEKQDNDDEESKGALRELARVIENSRRMLQKSS